MTARRRADQGGTHLSERKIPEAELDVLACLQRSGEATAREIGAALRGYRPMAHGSVVTLLKRLEAKSLVTKRKADAGKAFVYRPTRGVRCRNRQTSGCRTWC